MMFCMLVLMEVMLLSLGVRVLAWTARRKGLQALKRALAQPGLAFHGEKHLLAEVEKLTEAVECLKDAVACTQVDV
jgi:hypothetical protein